MKTRSVSSRLLYFFLVLILPMFQVMGCGGGGGGGATSQESSQSSGPEGRRHRTFSVQIGTPLRDEAFGVATDLSGSVYVVGVSEGDIDNCGCLNPRDGFIAKYGTTGEMEWLFEVEAEDELESNNYASLRAVATGPDGDVYAAGYTNRDTAGIPIVGETDIVLFKLDPAGNVERVSQAGSEGYDYALAMASDPSGNVFLAGKTNGSLDNAVHESAWDGFVMMFDPLGYRKWTFQFGPGDAAGIALDAFSNVIVAGTVRGPLDDDVYLAKLDATGNLQWVRQLGTPEAERAISVTTDPAGNVYVAGWTGGDLGGETNAGGEDLFLAKFDSGGNRKWVRLLGTTEDEYGRAVTVDRKGVVYVSGDTRGSLAAANSGGSDAILAKYNANGNRLWTRQLGSAADDYFNGIAVDPRGDLFLAGSTYGDMSGFPNRGDVDAFVMKYDAGVRK